MKLVVGLGNPGKRYEGTRHNVGFVVVDLLAKSPGCGPFRLRFDAELAECHADQQVLLAKPLTFMNRSGRCVRELVNFFQLERTDLLVVCDDIALPLGRLRARARGTHGGHNGLRDIQHHLGTTDYARLRLGVGAPVDAEPANYVLDRFRPDERAAVDDMLRHAVQAVDCWLRRGIEACMNEFNAKKS